MSTKAKTKFYFRGILKSTCFFAVSRHVQFAVFDLGAVAVKPEDFKTGTATFFGTDVAIPLNNHPFAKGQAALLKDGINKCWQWRGRIKEGKLGHPVSRYISDLTMGFNDVQN